MNRNVEELAGRLGVTVAAAQSHLVLVASATKGQPAYKPVSLRDQLEYLQWLCERALWQRDPFLFIGALVDGGWAERVDLELRFRFGGKAGPSLKVVAGPGS